MKSSLSILLLLIFVSFELHAQDEDAVYYGKKYVSLKLNALEKYSKQIDRQQKRIVSNLSRQEKRLQHKLIHSKDSILADRLHSASISFDSISKIQHSDSASIITKIKSRSIHTIDSLKAIHAFANMQGLGSGSVPAFDKTSELQSLQKKLAWQQYLNGLIEQRGKQLQNLALEKGGKLSAFTSIQKTLYYGKGKMAAYKQIADDPSIAEEKALEYLEGTEGFSQAMQQAGNGGSGPSMQSAKTVEDLERMGFQTRRQVNAGLKEKFGENTQAMQQSMAGQVGDWQKSMKTPLAEIKSAKQQLSDAKAQLTSTRSGINGLKNASKLSFKPNPMRGLPFSQRLEKSYSYNVRRADAATASPTLLEGGAVIGFKHTPKLSYGIGVATSIGLGKDWNSVHLSLEGIGLRSYASWQWQWGIGAYAGYERLYKKAVFKQDKEEVKIPLYPQKHETAKYSESVLLGLTKTYRINSKWNGAVQVLYDVWWKDKNLNSPIVIRFNTGK